MLYDKNMDNSGYVESSYLDTTTDLLSLAKQRTQN